MLYAEWRGAHKIEILRTGVCLDYAEICIRKRFISFLPLHSRYACKMRLFNIEAPHYLFVRGKLIFVLFSVFFSSLLFRRDISYLVS